MFSPFSRRAPSSYRLLSFARVLTQKGHNVTVILPGYDRHSGFNVECNESDYGIKLVSPFQLKTKKLPINSAPYSFAATLKGLGVKADVLHVLKPTPLAISGYSTKFFRGLPIVQDIDDLDHLVMKAERHSNVGIWIMQQCEQVIPRFADKIVVSNTGLKNLYCRMGLTSKVCMIPNGVFVDEFAVDRDNSLKERYGLKEKVVTYVGSLNTEVQLKPLILAMQKIVKERKDVSCLIVGDGPARVCLQQLATDLGIVESVIFAGEVPHSKVPSFLSISDLGYACFPPLDYLNYVSNIKVFEYMAAGVPAIVSPTGDLPVYVDHGRCGIISIAETDALSSELSAVLSEEKRLKELSKNAKQYVKNFDWAPLTERLLKTYEEP
jgi:glycosyltransferase involved in cell wall biosynthesis